MESQSVREMTAHPQVAGATLPSAIPASKPSVLITFHPGWFGAVMGTAILGVAAFMNPGGFTGTESLMAGFGVVMVALAYVLTVVLGIPYVWRWIRYPDAAWKDLCHPVLGPLYATFPGGILVLGSATASIGPTVLSPEIVFTLVAVLAAIGTVLAFAIGVCFECIIFGTPDVAATQIHGGWFIPPVVSIIVPMVLVPLIPSVDITWARLLLVVSYAAWGIGFFLYLLVVSLFYNRLVHHPLPAAPLAPSLWIGLGPVGVGSLALMRMAQGGAGIWNELSAAVTAFSSIGALALWGFGVWWLVATIALMRRYWSAGSVPFGVGWWAFTFPLGAFTVSTLTLARAWKVDVVESFGMLLFGLLAIFWLMVTFRTLMGVRSGEVWRR